jgi:hypothetical protein
MRCTRLLLRTQEVLQEQFVGQLCRLHPIIPQHSPLADHVAKMLPNVELVELELRICREQALKRCAKAGGANTALRVVCVCVCVCV